MATVDRQFEDYSLAVLYDTFCEVRADFGFYLPLIMGASSVLDVGCGTGKLLHLAREAGHTGRLRGIDPAAGMLKVAQGRDDIEWVQGKMADVRWEREFDLIVMTGHAFQVYTADEELRRALASIRAALRDDGRFIFETRNPLHRAWEEWTPENVDEISFDGSSIQTSTRVDSVEGELVSFTSTFSSPTWDQPRASQSTLRFLPLDSLRQFLVEAGFEIETQYGDWDRSPLTKRSVEIITLARRASD